ncbi:MAG: hypothetical protein ACRDQX_13905 [Pseudonocardiaceae bacterium]
MPATPAEELRTQIEAAQRDLVSAEKAGLTYRASLHRARLQDLMYIAAGHGIDVTTWEDHSLKAPVT